MEKRIGNRKKGLGIEKKDWEQKKDCEQKKGLGIAKKDCEQIKKTVNRK